MVFFGCRVWLPEGVLDITTRIPNIPFKKLLQSLIAIIVIQCRWQCSPKCALSYSWSQDVPSPSLDGWPIFSCLRENTSWTFRKYKVESPEGSHILPSTSGVSWIVLWNKLCKHVVAEGCCSPPVRWGLLDFMSAGPSVLLPPPDLNCKL